MEVCIYSISSKKDCLIVGLPQCQERAFALICSFSAQVTSSSEHQVYKYVRYVCNIILCNAVLIIWLYVVKHFLLLFRFGRSFTLTTPIEDYKVFYIGVEGPTLSNLMLNFNKCQFYSYNPVSREGRRETLNVNKALGRRWVWSGELQLDPSLFLHTHKEERWI